VLFILFEYDQTISIKLVHFERLEEVFETNLFEIKYFKLPIFNSKVIFRIKLRR
jgi:hypothetical protein